ncbi:tRNA-splicing endonuclease subunit [Dimargaris xerosporica]|nr:tRNA-splicing endonuclease subunit [Dimargaris xerosporica]
MSLETPFVIHLCGGVGLMWDPQAIKAVRQQHRIIGTLAEDTAPAKTAKAPLVLTPEETTLLLELGVAKPATAPLPDAAMPSPSWAFPQTPTERQRYQLFRDLWTRGYYLTSGLKFGGEFLVYSGDPSDHHSLYITTLVASPTSSLTPRQIITQNRLGTGVTKSQLLCTYHAQTNRFEYATVTWDAPM